MKLSSNVMFPGTPFATMTVVFRDTRVTLLGKRVMSSKKVHESLVMSCVLPAAYTSTTWIAICVDSPTSTAGSPDTVSRDDVTMMRADVGVGRVT